MHWAPRLFIVFSILLSGTLLNGQSIARSAISAFGSTFQTGQRAFQQTIGQSSPTKKRQGFIQPNQKATESRISLKLFPNPTRDKIQLINDIRDVRLTIFNAHGLELLSTISHVGELTILSVASWPAGTYYIRFENPAFSDLVFAKI
mgnify:CR=1 FL=1